jgi:hypothetical protein
VLDSFGFSLSLYHEIERSIDFKILVAGAPNVNKAYTFLFDPRSSVWSQNAIFQPQSGPGQFGFSVGVYDSTIAIGAPTAVGDTGMVTTYKPFNGSNTVVWRVQSQARSYSYFKKYRTLRIVP